MKNLVQTKLMGGALVLAGALLTNTAPVLAQDYGYPAGYNNAPVGQLDNLVQRIALYPDPLLAQIFAAAAYPDQIAAAAQGAGGPFDPSVEALMQYPSVLQMMASDPAWTQALGEAVMQDQGALMDTIQNLRREAQQYGYLQSGPQMQVVDDGGYIGIQPAGGYMYVPVYDPYVVFAPPRPGFFVGGVIRFGGGFRWSAGYNSFNWRNHEVVVNRRVWTPPVRRVYDRPQAGFGQRRFEDNRRNFTPEQQRGNFGRSFEQRNFAAPQQQPQQQQRNFAPQQQRGNFGRPFEQRSFTAPQQQPQPQQQRNFTAPQQQRNFTAPQQQPQPQQQRNFTAPQQQRGNFGRPFEQRSFTAPQQQPQPQQQRSFTPEQPRGNFGRTFQQHSFTAPQQQPQQRNFAPQQQNQGQRFGRGNESHGRGR